MGQIPHARGLEVETRLQALEGMLRAELCGVHEGAVALLAQPDDVDVEVRQGELRIKPFKGPVNQGLDSGGKSLGPLGA